MVELNSIPWSPVLLYVTPLPMNRTPVSTVGGPFPPFCGTLDPSRSTGPHCERRRSVSSVVRYARPRFHRLFRPSPPDEHDHAFRFDRSAPTQVRFVRFAVRHTPPDQQDPVSTVGGPTQVRSLSFCGTPDPS